LLGKAADERFHVDAWTPCVLSPTEQKWFDGWATSNGRKYNATIQWWNGVHLRRYLLQEDAESVRRT
jgi:hypothetical protein